MARAMAVRCFWPPERVMPRSPTMVSKPWGNSRISVGDVGGAGGGFDLLSRRVARRVLDPKAMFSAMVVEKRKVSCGTKPMAARRVASG